VCNRYVQTRKARERARLLAVRDAINLPEGESWNVAPSEQSLIVYDDARGLTRDVLHWGFLDRAEARPRFFNTRLETADSLPTFRDAWENRRCVVPVDGWYEWLPVGGGKQPYFFHLPDDAPLFLAALWERRTFAIVTMEAEELSAYHNRRPVAFGIEDSKVWIYGMPACWKDVAKAAVSASRFAAHAVSRRLNSSRDKIDVPDLIEPIVLTDKAEP